MLSSDDWTGMCQSKKSNFQEIKPGDIIYFEPGEKHWHGAAVNNAMSHIAIQEEVNGAVVWYGESE